MTRVRRCGGAVRQGEGRYFSMKDTTDHLGILALGYMWNHPLQQLNDLLEGKRLENLSPHLMSALRRLTMEEKRALKKALAGIFAQEISDFSSALDETSRYGNGLDLEEGETSFGSHMPPWNDRLSYFDREGNPRAEFVQ
jgi:hypothetical protein